MLNESVAGLVAAYVLVTMLLLSLNLTSLWRWWVKAAAIVLTTASFGVSYAAITGLMGWPTTHKLPTRFNLVSSLISEPNKRTKDPGHIYLWATELDANNVPSGTPRSYQISYTNALARKIADAQEKHDKGQDVMGVLADRQPPPDTDPRSDIKAGRMQNDNGQQSPATDTATIKEVGDDLTFEELPPVLLPDKGPLLDPSN
ncbi:MAG TPA: hypothetical protein VGM32_10770 [Rhodopila sp.]|jgi:hypothetical protein